MENRLQNLPKDFRYYRKKSYSLLLSQLCRDNYPAGETTRHFDEILILVGDFQRQRVVIQCRLFSECTIVDFVEALVVIDKVFILYYCF